MLTAWRTGSRREPSGGGFAGWSVWDNNNRAEKHGPPHDTASPGPVTLSRQHAAKIASLSELYPFRQKGWKRRGTDPFRPPVGHPAAGALREHKGNDKKSPFRK